MNFFPFGNRYAFTTKYIVRAAFGQGILSSATSLFLRMEGNAQMPSICAQTCNLPIDSQSLSRKEKDFSDKRIRMVFTRLAGKVGRLSGLWRHSATLRLFMRYGRCLEFRRLIKTERECTELHTRLSPNKSRLIRGLIKNAETGKTSLPAGGYSRCDCSPPSVAQHRASDESVSRRSEFPR